MQFYLYKGTPKIQIPASGFTEKTSKICPKPVREKNAEFRKDGILRYIFIHSSLNIYHVYFSACAVIDFYILGYIY